MKIPEKVRITGIDYDVKFCDTEKREGRWGAFSASRLEIRLSPEIKDTPHAIGALIHEIIHCIDVDMQIKLKENQIIALGSGLNQVLQDNYLNLLKNIPTTTQCELNELYRLATRGSIMEGSAKPYPKESDLKKKRKA